MKFQEIAIISGKGGTGKTSLTASLAPFIDNAVIADCDVDGPDLHILLKPKVKQTTPFIGTFKAKIDPELCTGCMACARACKFDAISGSPIPSVSRVKCEGCGVCERICPLNAVTMEETVVGEIYHSTTDFGPMVHARLIPGEETSGKLVSEVRRRAKEVAENNGHQTILIDGPPGIGCNVISSITGVKKIIIVTEPTESGLHDLQRVFSVTKKFYGTVSVIINRYNISEEVTEKVITFCNKNEIPVLTKIPFDKRMVDSITNLEIPSLAEKEFFNKLGWEQLAKEIQKPE